MTNLDSEHPIKHSVYRIYDVADRLLYVGCSTDAEGRIRTWHDPRYTKMCASWHMSKLIHHWTIEDHPNKVIARRAERLAIANEAPLFNTLHNKGRQIDGDEYDRRWPGMRTRPSAPENANDEDPLEADRRCTAVIERVFESLGRSA